MHAYVQEVSRAVGSCESAASLADRAVAPSYRLDPAARRLMIGALSVTALLQRLQCYCSASCRQAILLKVRWRGPAAVAGGVRLVASAQKRRHAGAYGYAAASGHVAAYGCYLLRQEGHTARSCGGGILGSGWGLGPGVRLGGGRLGAIVRRTMTYNDMDWDGLSIV